MKKSERLEYLHNCKTLLEYKELDTNELIDMMCHKFKMQPSVLEKYIPTFHSSHLLSMTNIEKIEKLYDELIEYHGLRVSRNTIQKLIEIAGFCIGK